MTGYLNTFLPFANSRKFLKLFVLIYFIFCNSIFSFANDFPSKPIKIVVAFPPGGATDVIARLIAQKLSEKLKQPVIVENKVGAGGMIGTDFTAKSTPDGYTITYTASQHVVQPHLIKNMRYDAQKDFSTIAVVGNVPNAFVVHSSLPVNNINEFIKYARENSGKLNYGSWGVGSSSHVFAEMIKNDKNLSITHVPFQGAAPALFGLMSGQIQMLTLPFSLVDEKNRPGSNIKVIGITTSKRMVALPEVATFAEQGVEYRPSWQGFLGPANIPNDVINILNREISSIVSDPQMIQVLAKNGVEVGVSSPQEYRARFNEDYEYWERVLRLLKIQPE